MKIQVAAVQMACALGDKAANLAQMERAVRDIVQTHLAVDLIVFPECAVTGYECPELYPELAEPYPHGASIERLCRLAREAGVFLAFGFVEAEGAGETLRIYNSAALIDRNGRPLGRHRKVHLVAGMETEAFAAGDAFAVYETEIGRIGMMICWDTAFPESARLLALHGAELILVPEAVEKGIERQWALALAARAFDNGAFVLSCNHAGQDRTLTYFGESTLLSPDGEPLARLGEEADVLFGTVEYDRVAASREYFYMLRDRRPEVYQDLCKP